MGVAGRLLLLAILSPILFVVSAAAWVPVTAWHAVVAPRASGVIGYRVAEAAAGGTSLDPRHDWVPLERMPVALLHAVLAAEDTRFYEHHGFDLEQIRKAWRANRPSVSSMRQMSPIRWPAARAGRAAPACVSRPQWR